LRPRKVALLAAAWLVVVSATTGARWYAEPSSQDYRGATVALAAGARPGDVVLLNPGWLSFGYDYYLDRLELRGRAPARTGEWQIKQTWQWQPKREWPPSVWIVKGPFPAPDDEAFLQALRDHGYVVEGPPIVLASFEIWRYALPDG